MSDNMSKNKVEAKATAGVITAAVTGAVIGAGVVAAGVVAMKNKKNQQKAKDIIDDVKAKASSYMHAAKDQVKDKVEEGKSKVEKTAAIAKKSNEKVQKVWQK